jgi:hypothetical protein
VPLPGWAAFFALFAAGVAMGTRGIVPRWVSASGYILALVSAVARLVLVTIYASPCLPVARFLGFLWLILVSLLLALEEAEGTLLRSTPQAQMGHASGSVVMAVRETNGVSRISIGDGSRS